MGYRYFAVVFGIFAAILLSFIFLTPTGFSVFDPINKYNFNELPSTFEITKGNEFKIDIDSEEGYLFSDDSNLFDINNETGIINFIPGNTGNFNVVIIALKDVEDLKYKLVTFEVYE